jgi:hypothetical protein
MQSIEKKIISRIYGHGRGWCFSQKDFANIGSRSSVDTALHRLQKKGKIQKALRGIYYYPRFSDRLNRNLSPDVDHVANALARKFNWRIQPSGPTALNMMGLSSQVPSEYTYLSDGPDRLYTVGRTRLLFRHAATKNSGFRFPESALIVQALRSLGKERITPQAILTLRKRINPGLCKGLLADTRTVTGWIYEAIQAICKEVPNG